MTVRQCWINWFCTLMGRRRSAMRAASQLPGKGPTDEGLDGGGGLVFTIH